MILRAKKSVLEEPDFKLTGMNNEEHSSQERKTVHLDSELSKQLSKGIKKRQTSMRNSSLISNLSQKGDGTRKSTFAGTDTNHNGYPEDSRRALVETVEVKVGSSQKVEISQEDSVKRETTQNSNGWEIEEYKPE